MEEEAIVTLGLSLPAGKEADYFTLV